MSVCVAPLFSPQRRRYLSEKNKKHDCKYKQTNKHDFMEEKKACRHGSCGKFDKPKAGVRGGRDRPRKLRIYGAREEAGGRGRLER